MKLCILAAGKGSRISNFDKCHKALLPINNVAILSLIIDKFPKDIEIIIAVHHNSHLIKQYCEAVHSKNNITYVDIDNIDSPNGPGYSLFQCKKYLQEPFYLSMTDCLITDKIPSLNEDWIGLSNINLDKTKFATANCENGNITKFSNKSNNPCESIYIGFAGIKNYEKFFNNLIKYRNKDECWEQVCAFYNPQDLKGIYFNWIDTGTTTNYLDAIDKLTYDKNEKLIIKKIDIINEITYKYNGKCTKLFLDSNKCLNKIYRWGQLRLTTPEPYYINKNILSYKWIKGNNLDSFQYLNTKLFNQFLEFAKKQWWTPLKKDKVFEKSCLYFYKNKTFNRIKYITLTQNISKYILNLNYQDIAKQSIKSCFHGDAIFSNIIHSDNQFIGIDWRESFGNGYYGDVYYDLAKIYMSLNINFSNIEYNCPKTELITQFLVFCKTNNYNIDNIKKITSLILLNIAGLYLKQETTDIFLEKFKEINYE